MAPSNTASTRDDDPPHPNFDGIVFRPTTDRKGVVVTPAAAQTVPPVTYLPVEVAAITCNDLRAIVVGVEAHDPQSYLALFLRELTEDFAAAIDACEAG